MSPSEKMLSIAERCEKIGEADQADAWRRHAAECSEDVRFGDRVVGILSKIVIFVSAAIILAEPLGRVLIAFGDASARWLS